MQFIGGVLTTSERERILRAAKSSKIVGNSTSRFYENQYKLLETGPRLAAVHGLEDRLKADRSKFLRRLDAGVGGIVEELHEFAKELSSSMGKEVIDLMEFVVHHKVSIFSTVAFP